MKGGEKGVREDGVAKTTQHPGRFGAERRFDAIIRVRPDADHLLRPTAAERGQHGTLHPAVDGVGPHLDKAVSDQRSDGVGYGRHLDRQQARQSLERLAACGRTGGTRIGQPAQQPSLRRRQTHRREGVVVQLSQTPRGGSDGGVGAGQSGVGLHRPGLMAAGVFKHIHTPNYLSTEPLTSGGPDSNYLSPQQMKVLVMSDASSKPVALITGASSGIGAVYADRLAARGYDLILVARRGDRLTQLATSLSTAHGAGVETLVADLTAEADLKRVEAVLTGGAASVLVNNAGLSKLAPMAHMAQDDATNQVALNVVALTRLTRAILPVLVARNAGAVINVASVMGLHSMSFTAVYSGTKSYVVNFSRGLQDELAGTDVRVQVVMPAAIATDLYVGSGMSLAQIPPEMVMTPEALVDTALAGFDAGETFTLPSVHDLSLWQAYDTARIALFGASQTGTPAPRYGAAGQAAVR